jgi:hypothetical protein
MHEELILEYSDIDNNSIRFAFPPDHPGIGDGLVAFMSPSYVGLAPPHVASGGGELAHEENAEDTPRFTCVDGFLYYPGVPVPLESLIRARLRLPDNVGGMWAETLGVWAISYLWGHTMAPEDILDGVKDEEVKT